MAGTLGILCGFGSGKPLMEFPPAIWPVLLLSYVFITVWSFIQVRCSYGGKTYVGQWYLLAAVFWFPWVYLTGHLFVFVFNGHPVMAAGINAWYKYALILLFFTPVALGTAYYLVPKITGRPIYSYSLALYGFWALAVIGQLFPATISPVFSNFVLFLSILIVLALFLDSMMPSHFESHA